MAGTRIQSSYIFSIDTPLIMFNNRLLQLRPDSNDPENYVRFSLKTFSLEEIATPSQLEELFCRHNIEKIDTFKHDYARKSLNKEFQSKEIIEHQVRSNAILKLIVEKILPEITSSDLYGKIAKIISDDKPGSGDAPDACDVNDASRAGNRNGRHGNGNRMNGAPHQGANESSFNNGQIAGVPPEIMEEVNRVKRQLISKLDADYKGYVLDSISSAPVVSANDVVNERVRSIFAARTCHAADMQRFPQLKEASVLEEMLNGNNFMILDDKAYSLMPIRDYVLMFSGGMKVEFASLMGRLPMTTDPENVVKLVESNRQSIDHKYISRIINKIESSMLRINGMYFIPFYWDSRSELERRYAKLLEKKLKVQTIEDDSFYAAEISGIAKEKERLESIAKMKNYERNNAGFEIIDGLYYVYTITPAYALKSPHRGEYPEGRPYLPFKPAKVGVSLRSLGDGQIQVGAPVIMHEYTHPFLGGGYFGKSICLGGGFSASSIIRSYPPEQAVSILLSQGVKTLMMGYMTGSNPYMRLCTRNWYSSHWISKRDADKKGLVVLNDFKDGGA